MKCARTKLVPFVLCTTGLVLLSLVGCSKSEPESVTVSPEVYMNDPVFRKGLDERHAAQKAIVAARAPLVKRMEELAKAANGDEAKLKALAEWNDLHQKVTALNARYEEGRKELLAFTRSRMLKKEVSK